MTSYSFHTVKELIVEDGGLGQLATLIKERFNAARIMVVTDTGLVKLGFVDLLIKPLRAAGYETFLFDQVLPDPPEQTILDAVLAARDFNADLVIGLGGGSSIDVAKLVAALKDSNQALSDVYGVNNLKGDRLPLIQIPTTAGSGSEATAVAIVTTGAESKIGIVSPVLYADIAFLDAELTLGLPRNITAYTAIDAMVHAVEAYTSIYKKNAMSDLFAKQAIKLIGDNFKAVIKDGNNLNARRDVLLGACLAGSAFANAPVAAVHALAYPIGAIHHVPHGLSNALMLPAVLRFNAVAAEGLYAELAAHAGLDATAQALINWFEGLISYSGLPARLRDVGVQENDLEKLAEQSQLQTRLLVNNPRDVDYSAALDLYQEAW